MLLPVHRSLEAQEQHLNVGVFWFWESWGHCTLGPTFTGTENAVFEIKTVLGDGTAGQSAHNPAGKPHSN